MVGLTALGSLATTGLGVAVYMLDQDYDPLAPDARESYDQGHSLIVGTDVSLGVTCAAALATLILGFYTDWEDRPTSNATADLRLTSLRLVVSNEGGAP
jgi:hypothetical protein